MAEWRNGRKKILKTGIAERRNDRKSPKIEPKWWNHGTAERRKSMKSLKKEWRNINRNPTRRRRLEAGKETGNYKFSLKIKTNLRSKYCKAKRFVGQATLFAISSASDCLAVKSVTYLTCSGCYVSVYINFIRYPLKQISKKISAPWQIQRFHDLLSLSIWGVPPICNI